MESVLCVIIPFSSPNERQALMHLAISGFLRCLSPVWREHAQLADNIVQQERPCGNRSCFAMDPFPVLTRGQGTSPLSGVSLERRKVRLALADEGSHVALGDNSEACQDELWYRLGLQQVDSSYLVMESNRNTIRRHITPTGGS